MPCRDGAWQRHCSAGSTPVYRVRSRQRRSLSVMCGSGPSWRVTDTRGCAAVQPSRPISWRVHLEFIQAGFRGVREYGGAWAPPGSIPRHQRVRAQAGGSGLVRHQLAIRAETERRLSDRPSVAGHSKLARRRRPSGSRRYVSHHGRSRVFALLTSAHHAPSWRLALIVLAAIAASWSWPLSSSARACRSRPETARVRIIAALADPLDGEVELDDLQLGCCRGYAQKAMAQDSTQGPPRRAALISIARFSAEGSILNLLPAACHAPDGRRARHRDSPGSQSRCRRRGRRRGPDDPGVQPPQLSQEPAEGTPTQGGAHGRSSSTR